MVGYVLSASHATAFQTTAAQTARSVYWYIKLLGGESTLAAPLYAIATLQSSELDPTYAALQTHDGPKNGVRYVNLGVDDDPVYDLGF